MKIKVVRTANIQGKEHAPGEILDINPELGRMLKTHGYVEIVAEGAAPMKAENRRAEIPSAKAGKPRGRKR